MQYGAVIIDICLYHPENHLGLLTIQPNDPECGENENLQTDLE